MSSVSEANNLEARDFEDSAQRTEFYEQLKQSEHDWWHARQRLIMLKERQIFWFGDNSLMMWLLWQLVSYVVVAIVLMLLNNQLQMSLPLWQYMTVFGIQTLIFVITFASKDRLANHLQSSIYREELSRDQALNEMTILASDTIFVDIHANAPISLQHIHEHYKAQFRLTSLQYLLQQEIDAGRLTLGLHQIESKVLPPELADDELTAHANEMIYKSMI